MEPNPTSLSSAQHVLPIIWPSCSWYVSLGEPRSSVWTVIKCIIVDWTNTFVDEELMSTQLTLFIVLYHLKFGVWQFFFVLLRESVFHTLAHQINIKEQFRFVCS